MKRICLIFLILFLGCSSFNPIGPLISVGVMWLNGEAHKYYNNDLETTNTAVRNAFAALELPIAQDQTKDDGYRFIAGDKNRFKVEITSVRRVVTLVSIRVNIMGDKPYAELVYSLIDKQLNSFATTSSLQNALSETAPQIGSAVSDSK